MFQKLANTFKVERIAAAKRDYRHAEVNAAVYDRRARSGIDMLA